MGKPFAVSFYQLILTAGVTFIIRTFPEPKLQNADLLKIWEFTLTKCSDCAV